MSAADALREARERRSRESASAAADGRLGATADAVVRLTGSIARVHGHGVVTDAWVDALEAVMLGGGRLHNTVIRVFQTAFEYVRNDLPLDGSAPRTRGEERVRIELDEDRRGGDDLSEAEVGASLLAIGATVERIESVRSWTEREIGYALDACRDLVVKVVVDEDRREELDAAIERARKARAQSFVLWNAAAAVSSHLRRLAADEAIRDLV